MSVPVPQAGVNLTCGTCRVELTFASAVWPRGGGVRCRGCPKGAPTVVSEPRFRVPAIPITAKSLAQRDGTYNTDIAALWLRQEGRCALCLDPLTVYFGVDHDHRCCAGPKSCGACVRGPLCSGCNTKLGHLEGSGDDWIERAARYSAGLAPGRSSAKGSVWERPDGRWAFRAVLGRKADGTARRRQRNGFGNEADARSALSAALSAAGW